MKRHVDGLTLKSGPTESGVVPARRVSGPVGGELLPFNLLEILGNYWILLLIMLIPIGLLLYKKRDITLGLLMRMPF